MKKLKKFVHDFSNGKGVSQKVRVLILPVLVLAGVTAVVLAVIAIVVMPKFNPATQRGVGADGFQAFQEEGTSLGIDKTVSKEDVRSVLGDKAKIVSDAKVSKVFNLGGNRGQTATYNFVRKDGVNASVYVDVMMFKNRAAFDEAHVTTGTMETDKIKGFPAYYMRAQTLGKDREYRLMVLNGTNVYKFVMTQPHRNVQISEVSALASLKKLAAKANF